MSTAAESSASKMQLPVDLAAWTLEMVYEVVRHHEYEPGAFDYKEELNPTGSRRDETIDSIRRTVCSMANADGGYILFGVRDRHHHVASPDDRVVGLRLGGDLRKQFGDKIAVVQREVHFETSPRPLPCRDDPTRGVFVVYVPPSPLRPHMVQTAGVFYRRGEGGSADVMKFYEVRDQMLFTEERLRKATLFRLELAQYRQQTAALLQMERGVINAMLRFDTGAYKVLLADICGLLPPSSNLLQRLLDIPVTANLVNQFLQQTTFPGMRVVAAGQPDPRTLQAESILGNLRELDRLCEECERRLSEFLGPLGA